VHASIICAQDPVVHGLLSINGTHVHTIAEAHWVFHDLYLNNATLYNILFAHPKISHGLSNKGLPLLHCDQIPQINIDQLSNRWAPQSETPTILPKTPTHDVVIDGDVWNITTKVMKLT
jgi:hypothetical protein